MFNKKGENESVASRIFSLCTLKKVIKSVLLIIVLWFLYLAFIQLPSQEVKNKYYVDVTQQAENGSRVTSTIKISEARSLCHFDALSQAQQAAESEDLPENFNVNALYENQFVLCLRAIGL